MCRLLFHNPREVPVTIIDLKEIFVHSFPANVLRILVIDCVLHLIKFMLCLETYNGA